MDLLVKNRHAFAFSNKELGTCTTLFHHIETGNSLLVSQKAYRVPVAFRQELERQIKELEDAGVICPSHSPWAAPVILVSKKDQSMHLVVDYKKLNLVSCKDVYPLPNITMLLDSLGNACYFSTLDLRARYHQLSVAPEHIEKTAFMTHVGNFEYTKVPYGLQGAPSSFQRLMNFVLA